MLNAILPLRSLLIVVTLAGFMTLSAPTLRGDDAPPDISTYGKYPSDKADPDNVTVEGTLTIEGVSYELTHVAIYETNVCDEPLWVTVLASNKPIPLDELTDSLKKDGTDNDFHFFEPHIRLSYNAEGKLVSIFAWADNNNIHRSSDDDLKGEFVKEDSRITGTASLKSNEDSSINCDYDLKFSGDLIKATEITDKPESIAVKPGSDKPDPSRNTIEGTLSVQGVSYKPTHLVIYETTIDTNGFDEKRIKVHASCKPIPLDKLADSLRKDGTDNHFYDSHPHLVLSFDNEGKLLGTSFHRKNNVFSVSGNTFNGELEVKDGRVNGSASYNTGVDSAEFDFDLKFSDNLFKANEISDKPESIAEKPGADKPDPSRDMVEGTLDVNGVSYNLAHHVIFEETVDFNGFDEDRINVLASSAPIPPDVLTDEYFFFLKPQLILSFNAEGKLRDIGCRANNCDIHIGSDDLNGEIEVKEGRVSGSASYKSKADHSTKLAFDLKFAGGLQKTPKAEGDLASGGAAEKKSATLLDFIINSMEKYHANEAEFNDEVVKVEMSEKADDDDKVEDPRKEKPTGELPNVYDLPIPEDAQNVEYMEKFDSIKFRTLSSHRSVAESLIKKLEEQGWSSEVYQYHISSELAMIASQLGDSQIMISAYTDGNGSKVTIMFEGLSWEKKKKPAEEKSAPSKKAPQKTDDDSAESKKEE